MDFREPDNPKMTTIDVIMRRERDEPGKWVGEPKGDGWRSPLYNADGTWIRHSKYQTGPQAKTPMPRTLIQELEKLEFPKGTAFDAEWMGPRSVAYTHGHHWLIIYDLLYFNGQWQGDIPYKERKQNMTTLINLHRVRTGVKAENIIIVPYVEKGFKAFYDEQKKNPLSEGGVWKRWDSTLKGGGDNPAWLKVRCR